MPLPPALCIVGPTGSGKSALALRLAERLGAEIIGADSMQVYRQMDIGTAKPSAAERKRVRHHLIDVADPDEAFSAARFREEATAAMGEIAARGKRVIVAGGTGLYIRALTRGLVDTPEGDPQLRETLQGLGTEELFERLRRLDPDAAGNIHQNNRVRVIRAIEVAMKSGKGISEYQQAHRFADAPFPVMMIGIEIDRAELYRRIESRVDEMIGAGLDWEVKRLLAIGYGRELKPMRGVGYKEMIAHLLDGVPMEETISLIKRDSRRYAKRQLTWFRKEPLLWDTAEAFTGEEWLARFRNFFEGKEGDSENCP